MLIELPSVPETASERPFYRLRAPDQVIAGGAQSIKAV